MIFLDNVYLPGEGQYNLNSLKEIKFVDSFLELDESVRNCQNQESYENCTTRLYINALKQKCGCLPLSINVDAEEESAYIILLNKTIVNDPFTGSNLFFTRTAFL